MEQEFAGACFVVIGYISVGVRTDMQVEQKGLAVFDEAVGILEIGLAFADGFDLSAAEGDAGFKFVGQKVVVACHAVVGSIALSAGDGVSRADGLLGAGVWVLDDDMAGLAGHLRESSNLYGSTGMGFGMGFGAGGEMGFGVAAARLC